MTGSSRFPFAFRCLLASAIAASPLAAQTTDPRSRVSVGVNGVEGDRGSGGGVLSRDARWVAFDSGADNLVPGDVEGHYDVFVHDRTTGATVRVSVDSNGVAANQDSEYSSISADGRFVAFASYADNLIAVDHNGAMDVFVHDRDPDGNGIFDEGNGVTTRASERTGGGGGNDMSYWPSLSADGRLVAFTSFATNLVNGDQNLSADIFVRDLVAGTTTRVSVDSNGAEADGGSFAPALSRDGRFVAFQSDATNLVAGDTNGCSDVFVHDLTTGATVRASVSTAGVQGNRASSYPSICGDGSRIAFQSAAGNFSKIDQKNGSADVFLHDFVAGTTELVSVDSSGAAANDASFYPLISEDGKTVAFSSDATNLSANDADGAYDVFVRDLAAGTTTIVSQTAWLASAEALPSALSGDGRFVLFWSDSADLVPDDDNADYDLFLYDRAIAEPVAASVPYGTGYPGSNGIPNLSSSSAPVYGATTTLAIDNSSGAWTPALVAFGFGRASIPTRAGGTLLVDAPSFVVQAIPPTGLSLPFTVPLDPALCGLTIDLQALELDPGASSGISFTPGLEWTFGN
jgi:Tol biopolymer transport system component